MLSDEALHEKLLRGDLGAFDPLYERHARPLFAFIRKLLADAHEAEDVLHETFMTLLKQRDRAPATSLRAWLFAVARNLCLNRLRSRRRGARALDAVPAPDEMMLPDLAIEQRQSAERLRRAVERLPAHLAELYTLRANGMSYEELAEVLSVPVGTVKSRMHEVVARLREEVGR